jgi:hypothetical protein
MDKQLEMHRVDTAGVAQFNFVLVPAEKEAFVEVGGFEDEAQLPDPEGDVVYELLADERSRGIARAHDGSLTSCVPSVRSNARETNWGDMANFARQMLKEFPTKELAEDSFNKEFHRR